MKIILQFRLGLPGLIALAIWTPLRATQSLDDLLQRLANAPFSSATVFAIEAEKPDAKTLPALKKAFDRSKIKEDRQWIAATILRLGERDQMYFDFLAGYAKIAVEDRAPSFVKRDSEGRAIRGELDPGFENWCAQNGKSPRAVAAVQAGVYPIDMSILAYAQDQRADDLFRRGLESPQELVLAYSIEGLGRLHDTEATVLIDRILSQRAAHGLAFAAAQLQWYGDPAAMVLMKRLIPDDRMRDFWQRQIGAAQEAELSRTLKRTGTSTAQR